MRILKNHKKFFYALDIGSSKIALAGAPYDQNAGELGPVFVESQLSKGIFKGIVNDVALLSDSIARLLKKMEEKNGAQVNCVAVSVNGSYIKSSNSVAAMALTEHGVRTINKRDMEKLMLQTRLLGLDLDEELLHEYALGYCIDRHNMILNPLGLQGRRFEMNSLLISAKTSYLDNIRNAIERAGCNVDQLVFSGVAASEGVLSREEKEKGVVLIDIGDTLTTILVYKDSILRSVKVLLFGGHNLTEIIAGYFKISSELANQIKESSLELSGDITDTQEIMIRNDLNYRSIKKRELIEIISPEIEKFIDLLKSMVSVGSLADMTGAEVVVTGGLSLLAGLLERIENGLGFSVRMGVVKGLQDVPITKAPLYVAAIGLLYLQKSAYQKTRVMFNPSQKGKLPGIIDYVKALYQDYF